MDIKTPVTLLGVCFLGCFVGFLLGFVIKVTRTPSLKVAVAVMAAGLSGPPILFMSGLNTYEKWMYPVGLVLGLLWTRLVAARSVKLGPGLEISYLDEDRNTKLPNRAATYFAWLDTILILIVTLIVILCAALTTFYL